MNSRLQGRIEKLEKVSGEGVNTVIYIREFSEAGAANLPDPEEEIARQRAEGKTFIVVEFVAAPPRACGCETVNG